MSLLNLKIRFTPFLVRSISRPLRFRSTPKLAPDSHRPVDVPPAQPLRTRSRVTISNWVRGDRWGLFLTFYDSGSVPRSQILDSSLSGSSTPSVRVTPPGEDQNDRSQKGPLE